MAGGGAQLLAEIEKLIESRHERPGREDAEIRIGGDDAEGVSTIHRRAGGSVA